jgi:hypothetical protein
LASEWLRFDVPRLIDEALGSYSAELVTGSKGGRYVAVGVKVPQQLSSGNLQAHWAIGLDTKSDFVLGNPPPRNSLYVGVRCNQSMTGYEGQNINRKLALVLGGTWERADGYWPIWRWPHSHDEAGNLLSRDEYIDEVLQVFFEVFDALI